MPWNLQAGMRPHRLRGDDAALEAELRWQAILRCIANSVPDLDRLVTTNMERNGTEAQAGGG